MNKTAAEVEMEVEASRGKLDRTMDALKDKMTPGQLFDEASHAMGGMGQQLLAKLMEQAKENPMPLAVMGVGLAWLMSGSSKSDGSSAYAANVYTSGGSANGSHDSGPGLKDKVQAFGAKAGDAISHAKHSVMDKASSAQDSAGQAAHDLRDKAGAMKDKAADYSQQAVTGAKALVDREPLLLAAIGLVVGVGLAAALPSTSIEDKAVGPLRDDLMDKGQAMVSDGLDKVTDTAQAAYGAVKTELGKPGEQAGDLPQRIENAAHAGVQAAREHPPQT
jgi:ElaB/YqjD/DUF883 family membrane-anchored ribosome-binding protein